MPPAKEPGLGDVRIVLEHFQMNPAGIEISNPHVAAALTCHSQYWGNTGAARRVGPQYEYKPGKLEFVDARWKPQERKLCVIFVIGGDPVELRVRRVRFHSGELYIPDKAEWRKVFTEMNNIVNEKREKCLANLKELIAGGAL